MPIPWFADTAEWVLREYDGPDVDIKIWVIKRVRASVWNLLNDYLWNENAAIASLGDSYPEDRLEELLAVYKKLGSQSVDDILNAMDDYNPKWFAGTNENRKYLLEKLWLAYGN